MKNLNSFRFLAEGARVRDRAPDEHFESGGGRITQETRLCNAGTGTTDGMRSKEEAHDYRYFPEPDLPPLVVDAARMPGFATRCRNCPRHGVPGSLTSMRCRHYQLDSWYAAPATLADHFEATVEPARSRKARANWVPERSPPR